MNKYNAEQDIRFIKEVLSKAQQDISQVGSFFIGIGLINLLGEICKNIGYIYLDSQEKISGFQWQLLRSIDIFTFITIFVIFLLCYKKLCHGGNDISKSILKIWGVLLIGGKLFTKIFINLILQQQNGIPTAFGETFEKAIAFLCIIIGISMLGIIVHKKNLCFCALAGIALYCLLLNFNITLTVAQIHENVLKMYVSDIFLVFVLSFGMIGLGIYIIRNGREKSGN